MGIKKYKPTSPGRRFVTSSDFEEVTRTTPEKSLLDKIHKTGGRNNNGRVTSRHIGGGHKRRSGLRLQAPQEESRPGGRVRVRPQPVGPHRRCSLRHARSATLARCACAWATR